MFLCKAIASRLQVGLRGHSPCKATQNIAMLQTNRHFNVRRVTWWPLLPTASGRMAGRASRRKPVRGEPTAPAMGGDHIRPKDCSQIDAHESPFLLPVGKKRVDKPAFPIFFLNLCLNSQSLPPCPTTAHGTMGEDPPPREAAQWRRSPPKRRDERGAKNKD